LKKGGIGRQNRGRESPLQGTKSTGHTTAEGGNCGDKKQSKVTDNTHCDFSSKQIEFYLIKRGEDIETGTGRLKD
jgi:hypothetical protein